MSLAVNPPPPNTTTTPPTDAPSRASLAQRSSTPHGYSAGKKRGFAGLAERGEREEEEEEEGKEARLDSGGPHGGDTTATDKDTPGSSQRPEVHVDPGLRAGTGTTEHESQSGSPDEHQRHDEDHQQHEQQGQEGDGGDDQQGADTPTPGSADGGNPLKKRKTTRSSRGVANLTPEQLERKRANGEWGLFLSPVPRLGTGPVRSKRARSV